MTPDASGIPGTPSSPDAPDEVSLAELERRAAARRNAPARTGVIVCDRLVRVFSVDGVEVQALQGLDLTVEEGELTALVGASGSGKSTLLNILAGLDAPTAGAASVAGTDLLGMDAAARLRYRRRTVGFVRQQTSRNLLPYLTAAQNTVLPMRLASGLRGRRRRAACAGELLDLLGIAHCRDRRPREMSGGEQQRTAIAVALANGPAVLLADEPTGELDSATGDEVFAALRTANRELGTTVLVVTHDEAVASAVHRTVAVRDGRIAAEVLRRTTTGDDGGESTTAREFAAVDRAGRLQLPREFTEALTIRDRVVLELEEDRITVRPDRGDASPG